MIPLLVIFKGENLCQHWIPEDIYLDWKFACNSKGWTSNLHGLEWLIKCFDESTKEKAGGKTCLLICDGHESHVTSDLLQHCRENNIVLLLLPPHTSHMTQPLDVAVFGLLKKAMVTELAPLISTEIARVQKVEWLEAYVKARAWVFTRKNILSGFRGAGLHPFLPNKVIRRLDVPLTPIPQTPTPETFSPFDNPNLNSSPSAIPVTSDANQMLLHLMDTQQPLNTPARKHVHRLTKSLERSFVRHAIVETQNKALTEVLGARKRRESGKRRILKGKHVATKDEVYFPIRGYEKNKNKSIASMVDIPIDPRLVSTQPPSLIWEDCTSVFQVVQGGM